MTRMAKAVKTTQPRATSCKHVDDNSSEQPGCLSTDSLEPSPAMSGREGTEMRTVETGTARTEQQNRAAELQPKIPNTHVLGRFWMV